MKGRRWTGRHEPGIKQPMAIDRKLRTWTGAGVIDDATAARIRAFETERESGERPVLVWAAVGLGLLALVLGILLLVAANWDRIPHMLKLGVHLALTAAAAVLVWRATLRRRPWMREGALFVLAGLVLGGISLQAQIYQLAGPIWQPLLMWLVLMTPAMLLAGQTRLTGHGWAVMLLATMTALAYDHVDADGSWLLVHGLWMGSPLILLLLSALPRFGGREFGRALRDAGIATLLIGASVAHFAWAVDMDGAQARDWAVRMIVPALLAVMFGWAGRRHGRVPAPLLFPLAVGPAVAVAAALCIPHQDFWPSRFAGFLIFAAMWGWVAHGAARAGWMALFAIAIAAIAIRLFIVYLELFGSLASTGGGLVIGGLLIVGLALGWHRLNGWFRKRAGAI